MEWKTSQTPLYEDLEPVIHGLGYSLVDLSRQQTKYGLQIRVVIYHYKGIGLNDCELVHKTILPRIELVEDTEDINLEVTSPGITRVLKHANEFAVFIDRKVRVLDVTTNDWIYGSIASANEGKLQLQTDNGLETIPYSNIKKAKLAYSQEDKEEK